MNDEWGLNPEEIQELEEIDELQLYKENREYENDYGRME